MNNQRHLSDSVNGNLVQRNAVLSAEHTQQTGGTAPSFLRNTHDMITFCDRSKRSVASWGNNGTCVMIHDMEALTRDIFPAYFKHSNFKSFARQLNFYGFRKIKSKDKECSIYHHEYFQINRTDLLAHIQRQTNENHHDTHSISGSHKIPTPFANSEEVKELKDKVNTLTATVSSLQMEIVDLKSLVTSLADGIRAHDEFIRHQVSRQGVPAHAAFDPYNVTNESLKPQAQQTSSPRLSPNNNNNNIINSQQITQESSPYIDVSQVHDHESQHSKRRKISAEESDPYAPIAIATHPFALPSPSNMEPVNLQGDTTRPDFENRPVHWTTYPSDNRSEPSRPKNIDTQAHNISYSSIDNPSENATTTPLNAECNTDQDYGFEDLAWFAIFDEEISHQLDDTKFAPQA